MAVPPHIVWKSSLQGIIEKLKSQKHNDNLLESISGATKFVKSGGCLEECYATLVELFKETTFKKFSGDSPPETIDDVFGCDEADALLASVLASDQLKAKEASKYIDEDFIRMILRVFQYHCSNVTRSSALIKKKNQWKQILHDTYAQFFCHREFIYRTSMQFFVHISTGTKVASGPHHFGVVPVTAVNVQNPEPKFLASFHGIAELLEVFGSIIQGFDVPLNKIHTQQLLNTGLIPLHENCYHADDMSCLGIYHRQLSFCIVEFTKKDESLFSQLLPRLFRTLPKLIKGGFSKPGVLIINECEQLLEEMPKKYLPKIKDSFFTMAQIAVDSLNYAVAQRCLLFLNTNIGREICSTYANYFNQNLVPILIRCCQTHWNDTTKQMSYQVLLHHSKNPESPISRNTTFRIIDEAYNERWQSEKDSESLKEKRMLEPKDNLSFTKLVFVSKLGEGSYSQVHHVRRIDHSVSQLYWEDYAMKVMESTLR